MATEIKVPELGESVLEATVSHWLKKEGDIVNVGDVLVELETDKVNLEVGAKNPGVLGRIEAPEGTDVKVGDVLGMINENMEQPATPSPAVNAPQAEKAEEKQAADRTDGQESQRGSMPQLTPVASRLARENNVDVNQLTGTGIEGRVTKTDVEQFLQQQSKTREPEKQVPVEPRSGAAEKPAAGAVSKPESSTSAAGSQRQEERMRMSRRRKTIA
jgi:2-oxoglutarate dehydrogenase E2 component (dihydrolipoamide succinyltransferase)